MRGSFAIFPPAPSILPLRVLQRSRSKFEFPVTVHFLHHHFIRHRADVALCSFSYIPSGNLFLTVLFSRNMGYFSWFFEDQTDQSTTHDEDKDSTSSSSNNSVSSSVLHCWDVGITGYFDQPRVRFRVKGAAELFSRPRSSGNSGKRQKHDVDELNGQICGEREGRRAPRDTSLPTKGVMTYHFPSAGGWVSQTKFGIRVWRACVASSFSFDENGTSHREKELSFASLKASLP